MEGPRRAGERGAGPVITSLVLPDPHSQKPILSSSVRDINSSILFSRQRGSGYLKGLRMTDVNDCKEFNTC